MDRIAAQIGAGLATTLTLVISKSGGTKKPATACWKPPPPTRR
jgi:glucose-6-phosphate isomerase